MLITTGYDARGWGRQRTPFPHFRRSALLIFIICCRLHSIFTPHDPFIHYSIFLSATASALSFLSLEYQCFALSAFKLPFCYSLRLPSTCLIFSAAGAVPAYLHHLPSLAPHTIPLSIIPFHFPSRNRCSAYLHHLPSLAPHTVPLSIIPFPPHQHQHSLSCLLSIFPTSCSAFLLFLSTSINVSDTFCRWYHYVGAYLHPLPSLAIRCMSVLLSVVASMFHHHL
jgi:hypothetical protein